MTQFQVIQFLRVALIFIVLLSAHDPVPLALQHIYLKLCSEVVPHKVLEKAKLLSQFSAGAGGAVYRAHPSCLSQEHDCLSGMKKYIIIKSK